MSDIQRQSGAVYLRLRPATSLRRAAEAMECELVYAFVPKVSLEASLRTQAEKAAKKNMGIVSHTMRLEDQGLSRDAESKQLLRAVRHQNRADSHSKQGNPPIL